MVDAPVEHGIEGRDLVHPHWGHPEQLCDIVHNADARPSLVLPLPEVKERNDCSLLILRRISRDDLFGPLHVVCCEREGYLLREVL